jgi:hypothetical protein
MTNECRNSNNDQSRVIRYIVTPDFRFNDLTRPGHSSFAWRAVAWDKGEYFVIPTAT